MQMENKTVHIHVKTVILCLLMSWTNIVVQFRFREGQKHGYILITRITNESAAELYTYHFHVLKYLSRAKYKTSKTQRAQVKPFVITLAN